MSLGKLIKFFMGDVAHDAADSGNPVKIGFKAKNIGSLPTAVTDADRVNGLADRYGAQFIQPGSSYVRSYNAEYSSAQTNVAMLTCSASESIRVYGLVINLDYDAQAVTSVAIGFGTASTPTTDGVIFESNGMVPGTYVIPFPVAVCGASNEDLRITSTDPTSGFLNINILYDIIAI